MAIVICLFTHDAMTIQTLKRHLITDKTRTQKKFIHNMPAFFTGEFHYFSHNHYFF